MNEKIKMLQEELTKTKSCYRKMDLLRAIKRQKRLMKNGVKK